MRDNSAPRSRSLRGWWFPLLVFLPWVSSGEEPNQETPATPPTQENPETAPGPSDPTIRGPNRPKHPVQSQPENAPQVLLKKYREQMDSIFFKYPKEEQRKVREEMLNRARTDFMEGRKTIPPHDKTIARLFDTLLDNLVEARSSFKTKGTQNLRDAWVGEAGRAFYEEGRVAPDAKREKKPALVIEAFLNMAARARGNMRGLEGGSGQVYAKILNLYLHVLKSEPLQKNDDCALEYQEQLKLIKRLFPTNTPEQKKANESLAKMWENQADGLFKEQSRLK